ncbi:ABC transporter ATP-binding protein [Caldivirga maquilingensis]|uniref:Oligopeptide/dipeptide ABC transporter, ATPase subunit n=1 Tax=Caldivirga maquilingensis (strain ATCC 700844 / DSM 13496 / JCM 10307 / IC-167) TaxID=397948 RepID=A8MBV8_CALMQ|nr:ABC transporter ATP-binding protein [Caldivirga maquilingensis]ABW01301.1 oligopeptide/dipeptide ABC transporter, ATPase subunit [Caldivirga maquilingensis IC-167]
MPDFSDTPWINGNQLVVAHRLRMWYTVRTGLFSKPRYVKAVDDVSISIGNGETMAIVGESGSGKTTLGRVLIRLLKPTGGELFFDGKDIAHEDDHNLLWFRRRTAIVLQDPFSSLNPYHNVKFIVEEPLIINGIDPKERDELVRRALEEVKLTPVDDYLYKYPHQLSGGQRQRVSIARAIVTRPDFIVADEPVSMLDASVRVEILTILKSIQERDKIAFAYITHDISTAKYFSDKILVMYAGKMAEIGSYRDVVKEPHHPYTQALIEAIPDPDPKNRFSERKVVTGEPPNLANPPPGCRFHPRCPFAMDICRREEPPMIEVKKGIYVACWLYAKR